MSLNLQQSIFEQFGLEHLPDTQKLQLLEQMTELVLKRTMLRVAERLEVLNVPQSEQQAILNAPTDDDRFSKIQQYVPDIGDIIQQEITTLQTELANNPITGHFSK
jgi:hypothetical protein